MKTKLLTGALATAACVMFAASAGAVTVTIGASEDGAPIATLAGPSAPLPGANFAGPVGTTFTVDDISSIDDGIAPHVSFLTNDLNVEGAGGAGGHTLTIFAKEQGIPGQLAAWDSHFTHQPLPLGWGVTQSTWLDPADGLFTTVDPLASHGFAPSLVTSSFDASTSLASGLGPFSVTEEIVITLDPGAVGSDQSTILLTGVPEPSTWAMLGLGFAGLGLLGMTNLRR